MSSAQEIRDRRLAEFLDLPYEEIVKKKDIVEILRIWTKTKPKKTKLIKECLNDKCPWYKKDPKKFIGNCSLKSEKAYKLCEDKKQLRLKK